MHICVILLFYNTFITRLLHVREAGGSDRRPAVVAPLLRVCRQLSKVRLLPPGRDTSRLHPVYVRLPDVRTVII